MKTKTLFAAYISDGDYLYGAEESPYAAHVQYWTSLRLERESFVIFELNDVPEDVASALVLQGTSSQEYSDGYVARNAAAPYRQSVMVEAWTCNGGESNQDDDTDE